MKKKIALLLAVIMTLTALPMTALADSSNGLTRVPTVVPNGTLFFEESVTGVPINSVQKKTAVNDDVIEAIGYYTDGVYLYMALSGSSKAPVGGVFDLTLENARWFIRNTHETENFAPAGIGIAGKVTTLRDSIASFNTNNGFETDIAVIPPLASNFVNVTKSSAGDYWYKAPIAGDLVKTYDESKGFSFNAYAAAADSNMTMSYFRLPGLAGSMDTLSPNGVVAGYRTEIPYRLDVLKGFNDTVARITILPDNNDRNGDNAYYQNGNGNIYEVRIPLICYTTATSDVRVKINSGMSGLSSSGAGYLLGVSSDRANTVVSDAVQAKFDFQMNDIKFVEQRIGSIVASNNVVENKPDFILDAPDGFSFVNLDRESDADHKFKMLVDGMIGYDPTGGLTDSYQGLGGEIPPRGYKFPSEAPDNSSAESRYQQALILWQLAFNAWNFVYFNTNAAYGTEAQFEADVNGYAKPVLADFQAAAADDGDAGYYWEYATDALGNVDYSRLHFFVNGLVPSTRGVGYVTFKNLRVYANDDGLEYKMYPIEFSGEAISKVSKDLLNRTNWTITLKTITDLPELVTGRYNPDQATNTGFTINNQFKAMGNAGDDHKTAKVQLMENSVAAWWSERETFLTLSEGVKFRKIRITKADNITNDLPTKYQAALKDDLNEFGTLNSGSYYKAADGGVFVNDGIRHGYVKVDGNELSISSIKITANKKATIEMDMWVSINVNFEGQVMLRLTGSAIPTQGTSNSTYEEVPAIAIANTIQPVVINTTVTDVKIGYQYQPVADIEIVETKAGALKLGKDLRLSLTDLVSSDNIIFNPASTLAVVEGNLKIGNISLSNNGGASQTTLGVLGGNQLLSTGADYITAIIAKASTVKSTLKLSNVSVKVDRNAPETNYKNYKAIAWGTAIAENYGPNRDEFGTIEDAGKAADYLKIITSATDKTSILTQEVRVTEGEAFYSVNGVVKEMDAKAYISVASNSMMVPLRFVSYAFGLRDDQIHWDNNAKVATVFAPTKTLQFAKDSDKMVVNGVVTSMVTQPVDGSAPRAIKAELVTDENNIARLYIPFRPLGQAFGVQVAWDGETRAAIYNPSANDNPNAADTNTFSSGTAE